MPPRTYWVCSCGRWNWASKTECIGCHAPPPDWIVQLRAHNGKKSEAPRNADGDGPKPSLPLDAFVEQPVGKRPQAKARAQARVAAEAAAVSRAANAQRDGEPAEVMEVDDDEPHGTDCLEDARQKVSEYEAVGTKARASIPDFDLLLAAARSERDELQRSRRAARPFRWRLVEAESNAKAKSDARSLAQSHLDSLRGELEKLQTSIRVADEEFARASEELSAANAAVAAIYAELAGESKADAAAAQRVDTGCAAQAAQGVAAQIQALPAAFVSGNTESAVRALQCQFDALLGYLDVPSVPHGVAQGASGFPANTGVPLVAAAGDVGSHVHSSGRRGTSPLRASRASDSGSDAGSDGRSRSRDRTADATEDEIRAGRQRRLDDHGFSAAVASDPYVGVDQTPAGG